MRSSKLPPILDISCLTSKEDIIDFFYQEFKKVYMGPQNIKYLSGKRIFFDFFHVYDNKFEFFWHLISLSSSEKFDILPCINDVSSLKCSEQNCITQKNSILLSSGSRNVCIYRGIRIHWVAKIITLAEKKDPSIKQWEDSGCLYIRFQHETVDYIVILSIRKKGLLFVSAYPIFYIHTKQIFDRKFKLYQTLKQSAASAE